MNTQLSPRESALALCHEIAMTASGDEGNLLSSVILRIAHLVIDEVIMVAENPGYYISVKEQLNTL